MNPDERRDRLRLGPIGRRPCGRGYSAFRIPRSAFLLAACLLAGCLDLDLTVKINEDGSALVTERVRLSEEVLDLASTLPANEGLEILLRRERAEERLALMGQGVKLVSHTVTDLPGGAKEVVAVYSAPDVNVLMLCSPAVAYLDTDTAPMRVRHAPHYTDGSGYNIGAMTVEAVTPRTRRYPRENPDGLRGALAADTPADLQKYRDLLPAFKDLMQDFRLTCRIECYAPVTWATRRETRSMTREYYVLKFAFDNLDQYGNNILDNEEFLLALIRWDLRSPHIADVVRHSEDNLTVPVWHLNAGLNMRYIALRPSKVLFDKYFKGKPKFYGGDLEVPRPANIHARDELIKWGIIKPE